MYFFNIGSNITALREFTALCKVDGIPLKKFLLGNPLKSTKDGSVSQQKDVRDNLVEEMGGVSALGKVSDCTIPTPKKPLTYDTHMLRTLGFYGVRAAKIQSISAKGNICCKQWLWRRRYNAHQRPARHW